MDEERLMSNLTKMAYGVFCFLFFWLHLPLFQVHAGEDYFSAQVFGTQGQILSIMPADLDENGSTEIVMVEKTGVYPNEKRWLSIFSADHMFRYSTTPLQRWEVSHHATMFEVGDVAPTPGLEIFFLTADGIRYYAQNEEGVFAKDPRLLLSLPTVTVFPSAGYLPQSEMLKDWKQNGGKQLLLPMFDNLVLFDCKGNSTWRETERIVMSPRTFLYSDKNDDGTDRSYSLRADYRLPRIFAKDFNGDGLVDMLLTEQESLTVHLQLPDGHFAGNAVTRMVLPVRPKVKEADPSLWFLVTPTDINGDGFADAVVTLSRNTGRFLERQLEVFLFLNQKRASAPFATEPDQKIIVSGITPGVRIMDINRDGRQDLVFSHIRLGFWNIVKNLVSKRVKVHTSLYVLQNNHRYPLQPDFHQKTQYQLDLTHSIQFRGTWPRLTADVTGDKQVDLVIARDGKVTVYPSDSDKALFSTPRSQSGLITLPFMKVVDLNSDGLNDLIFYEKKLKGKLSVLLNTGKWHKGMNAGIGEKQH